MNNKSSVWFVISSIINYFTGIVYSFTLILLPLGIYCFICAQRNNEFAKLSDAQLPAIKEQVKGWCIFSSIVNFPIGLIAIIPYLQIGDNGIKVTTVEEPNSSKETTESEVVNEETTENVASSKMDKSEIDEKIQKLTDFKNEGIISEEEYNRAVKELQERKDA